MNGLYANIYHINTINYTKRTYNYHKTQEDVI